MAAAAAAATCVNCTELQRALDAALRELAEERDAHDTTQAELRFYQSVVMLHTEALCGTDVHDSACIVRRAHSRKRKPCGEQ